jgi:hypothetical protein
MRGSKEAHPEMLAHIFFLGKEEEKDSPSPIFEA